MGGAPPRSCGGRSRRMRARDWRGRACVAEIVAYRCSWRPSRRYSRFAGRCRSPLYSSLHSRPTGRRRPAERLSSTSPTWRKSTRQWLTSMRRRKGQDCRASQTQRRSAGAVTPPSCCASLVDLRRPPHRHSATRGRCASRRQLRDRDRNATPGLARWHARAHVATSQRQAGLLRDRGLAPTMRSAIVFEAERLARLERGDGRQRPGPRPPSLFEARRTRQPYPTITRRLIEQRYG